MRGRFTFVFHNLVITIILCLQSKRWTHAFSPVVCDTFMTRDKRSHIAEWRTESPIRILNHLTINHLSASSTKLSAKLWERLQIEEDPEPMWYLLNCVAGLELDLLQQCRTSCQEIPDAVRFVVPTERKTRSHGANKMVTETKVKYPGYVFAKLRLCPETYEAVQGLDLCRSWMGTINHKGYKKLPPTPLALNELEVENFGLEGIAEEEEELDSTTGQEIDSDGVILDDLDDDGLQDLKFKDVDKKELKQYLGLKVEDMIKVTARGKFFNEDGIVRRLKDGKIFVRFYTYGTMFEEWLLPSDVRKLTDEEVIKGLGGPSQPITQREIDGPLKGTDTYQRLGDRPGDLRRSLVSNSRGLGAGPNRNRRQDRVADTFRNRDKFQNEYDRRREENNWNMYKDQRRQSESKDLLSTNDDQWNIRAGSAKQTEEDDGAFAKANTQWDQKSARQVRREQQSFGRLNNRQENKQTDAAIEGNDDWSAFMSPADSYRVRAGAGTSSRGASPDDFFSSLMNDLSRDLDSSPESRNQKPQRQAQGNVKPSSTDEDDFFASLMSELSKDTAQDVDGGERRPKQSKKESSSVTNIQQDDDFFASLEAELSEASKDTNLGNADDFFSQLQADLALASNIQSNSGDLQNSRKKSKSAVISVSSSVSLSPDKLNGLTVPDLKDMLRERGLKVSGKKSELVDRLLEASR